jgi:uncharacterized protein (DUF697 family)
MSTYEYETGEMELGELGELGEMEGELGELGELEGELGELGELEGELGEMGETGEGEQFLGGLLGGLLGGELESPLSEQEEVELASELLEVGSEQEMEQFLGNLFKGVANAVGGVIKSPIGQALGGVLKNVAKTALPVVGGALGSFVAPGVGTALGSKLGSMAGNLLEMEGETMSSEEAEFEVARNVVRLSAAAAQKAALAPPHLPPRQVAHTAVAQAARQVLPLVVLQSPVGAPVRAATARGAAPYGYRREGARRAPIERRRLATLPPSARLAAGYPVSRPPRARPVPAGAPGRYGAPRRHHHHHRHYGAPGYRPGAWDVGIEEPVGVDAGGYGAGAPYRYGGGPRYGLAGGAPYGAGGARRSGRWVRRGRKIILLGI